MRFCYEILNFRGEKLKKRQRLYVNISGGVF